MTTINNPELYNEIMGKKAKIKTETKYPDARKHQIVSFVKSAIRMIGYVLLFTDVVAAGIVLIASEAVGVLEELV